MRVKAKRQRWMVVGRIVAVYTGEAWGMEVIKAERAQYGAILWREQGAHMASRAGHDGHGSIILAASMDKVGS